ncbi:hypothetical protein QBC33DRAFT_561952 [Phialemonium atrogriseum]|uniref:NmrA-like domain-containing protein n=1 Tax=Phialemonium atrogriseum TaxID=1093897 RepID=A0AAJ0BVK1_9PEZI|nr:uncharacterized protein QBC33DRAFT_561952 [Phialemonium atrogriseum]KAK1764208.1 hypothetical protein QBC33DRAFT_561952 [Phialemonium atrogriseum]
MRVVVFGASGVQGAAQVAAVARAGHHPVAVSRSPKPLQIDGQTVETAAADFTDQAALDSAVRGADIVFLNLPSTSFQEAEPVIAAAKAVGEAVMRAPSVQLVVFNTSMPVPPSSHGIEAQEHRREIRDLLRARGIPLVSIQPVVFLDNLLEGWALPPILDTSTVVYCHAETLDVSWICHDDLARLMVAAMERGPGIVAGRDFAVGGPETVRLAQLTERLARGWGRPLDHESQSVDEFCDRISEAMGARSGLDAAVVVDQMRRAYTWYNEAPERPFRVDMGPVLEELPAALTTIEEWARRHPLPDRG